MADTESGLDETSLRQRLKRETAAVHQHLEAQLGLLDPGLDVHRYRRVLETFYGFYVPVEIDVTRLAAAEPPLGFPLRARAELIERDLLALGLSPAELAALPLCGDRPQLSCLEDLAGCLYVLEGACLGGQVISPLLHRRLGLAKGSGASFFAGDEEGTLPRWSLVVAWLEGLPRAGAATAKIISAATATFDAFARWVAVARGGVAVVDLNDCDREPIHIPGTIQPFGVLFVLDEELTVTQVSENVGDHLSLRVEEVLGRPLSEIVDPAGAEEVRAALREERWQDANPLSIGAHGKRFDGIVHRHEGAAILELEPNPETPDQRSMHHPFRPALLRMQRVSTLPELAAIVTQQMRRTTGFERVMFYRFHEDGMAPSTPRRRMRRSSRISACTIRPPTSPPRRASCISRTGCGSSSMPARSQRGSFRPCAPTRERRSTSASRFCAASRPFTSSTWRTWASALR